MKKSNLKKRIATLALISGVIVTPICIANLKGNADIVTQSNQTKVYFVTSGQTLGQIAKHAYGNSYFYRELAFYNNIDNSYLIHVGQQIVAPSLNELLAYCDANNFENTISQPAPIVETTPSKNNYEYEIIDGMKAYKVKKNDTMIKICNHFYGDSSNEVMKALCYYNKINDKKLIVIGDYIKLPSLDILMGCIHENENTNNYQEQLIQQQYENNINIYGWNYQADSDYTPNMGNDTYMIRNGNKLYGIAKFYYGNGSYDTALALYNNIPNKNQLPTGLIIALPPLNELLSKTNQPYLDQGNYIPINKYNELHRGYKMH